MQIADKYTPQEIEQKWYDYWCDHNLFHSEPDEREPFTIVIPPPNVTGMLHMGHMLNNTLQDVLVRRARMLGKNACWVPGTDHASIATEAKVVAKLKAEGIDKASLTREQFLAHAWEWKEKHGGIILKQLRKLGASCDWDRTCFTMDEARTESVISVFCDLYNKGKIYRGVRMVHWDPSAKTALSDEEVIYKESQGKLYYLRYKLEGTDRNIIVATTRPETILGDTAVCLNPNDPRYADVPADARVIVPLVGRSIPIIRDEYVDVEFGTGALKVTPAHDVNDYALGQKYDLTTYDIFTADAHVNVEGLEPEMYQNVAAYQGMDRFDCRKQIAADLLNEGLLDKTEDYTNKVGYSERTNVPIEPRLSLQWFIRMQHFADIALPPVMDDDIVFYPTKYKNTYRNWLENIKDWCISRQLWWGHRIPAFYEKALLAETGAENYPEDKIIVAPNIEAAAEKSGLSVDALVQDEGALDTWFSSWLWPISLFDGIENPGNEEINYYYPTADLVTGPDIIFFWVARMIMAGYEYIGKMPFRHVYFTGIVRDKLGRKMSKSLGNSPDPLDLIARYGADGVRMGMMLCAPAGNDILFDDSLCEQGRNFCNKIWNCFRLVKGWEVADAAMPETNKWGVEWFEAVLAKAQVEIADLFSKYRLSEALMAIYKLYCDEFSGWYLEIIKPTYGQPIDKETYEKTLGFLDTMLKLLHPFMPFITEELWQALQERGEGASLMVTPLEGVKEFQSSKVSEAEGLFEIISSIRNIRAQKNISPKEVLTLVCPETLPAVVVKLANVELAVGAEKSAGSASFIIGTTEYSVPLEKFINVDEELKKLQAELAHQEGFLRGVMGKLGNERFVQNAKPEVVELERKKKADAEKRIATLKEAIAALG